MSDLDEGRDVRGALGGLLVDEPTSPWSAADDVARGRALQRRRRTRAGAGIGLVAAAVMVFGVFGPWRPKPPVVVPPAYQPPALRGVDADWIAALDRSFTAFNGPVVDWSRSTVTPTAGGGFTLDLTLVGATVTTGGEDFTIEYAEPPGPPVARAFVTWRPAGGEGPVLASCAAPACERADRGVSPGFTEDGGRWDADGAQLAGTFVVDQTYDDGAVLELASAPHPDAVEGGWDASMNYGGITYVLDRVGRPSDGSPLPSDDVYGMTALLDDLGWTVDGVLVQRVPEGQPTQVAWSAYPKGGDPEGPFGGLTVRTWDESSWSAGADGINGGSVISQCDATTCTALARRAAACAQGSVCWSESSALLTQPIDGEEAGSYVLYRSDETGKHAVEVVVGPEQCPEVCPGDPYTAFLTEGEAVQVAERVQTVLVVAPTPSPTTTPSGIAAVTQVLEGFGFRVNTAQEFSGRDGWYVAVDVDPTADNPVDAVLTLAFFPDDGADVGSERVAVEGSVMNGCDEKTCEPVESITVPCPSNDCFQDWATTTTAAYDGVDAGTLVVFRSDGSRAIEAVVGVRSCPTCAPSGVDGAFLTLEQTQQVLAAAFVASAAEPSPSRQAVAACTSGQVKLVPAVDSTGGATGERSVAIEVYARNPSVSCTVEGFPSATLLVGAAPAPDQVYRQGTYNVPDADRGVAVVVDSSHAAVFVVAKYRCDAGATGRADRVAVTLPGSPSPVVVELPTGLAPELCGGAMTDAGHQVWVSAFTPREGGVA